MENQNSCPFFGKDIIRPYNFYNSLYHDEMEYFRGDYFDPNYTYSIIDYSQDSTDSEGNYLKDGSYNTNINNISFFKEVAEDKPLFCLRKRQRPGPKIKISQIINYSLNDKKPYIHTKNKFDNILNKLQVSYINFLVDFINKILEAYGRKDLEFKALDPEIKKKNKIEERQEIKEKTIGDILKEDISRKYTTLDKTYNLEIYSKLEEEGLVDILNILNQKFLFFFEPVYYKNLRKFNLKEFGLMDLDIEIPTIKLYEDLVKKNQKGLKFEEYKIKMEQCVKWHFLGGLEQKKEKENF